MWTAQHGWDSFHSIHFHPLGFRTLACLHIVGMRPKISGDRRRRTTTMEKQMSQSGTVSLGTSAETPHKEEIVAKYVCLFF